MNEEGAFKMFIHQMNDQAKSLNKDIIQKSATMQDIPVQKEIYKKQAPKYNAPTHPPIPQQQLYQQPVAPPPQIAGDPALLNSLIERVSAVEKQFTKLVTLIERRVAKNAKEINIRIKLNENNDSTNKE